jgi:hypothetical protein
VRYINNHVALLSDDEYLRLPVSTALLLHRLWLAFAETRSHLPLDTLFLSRICAMRVRKQQVGRLVDAGFIQLSGTRPSRKRYGFVTNSARTLPASRARAEVEVEVEVEPSLTAVPSLDQPVSNGAEPFELPADVTKAM